MFIKSEKQKYYAQFFIILCLFIFETFSSCIVNFHLKGPELSNSIVWTTVCNKGYLDIVRNFLRSRRRLGLSFQIFIWCTDEFTLQELRGTTYCDDLVSCGLFLKDGSERFESSLRGFGDEAYRQLVFLKLDALLLTRKYLSDKNVFPSYFGILDTDIAIFKDPTEAFVQHIRVHKNASAFSQCDEHTKAIPCSNPLSCEHLNSGVMVLQNSDIIIDILSSYTVKDLFFYDADQSYLRSKFILFGIKCVMIPRGVIANGAFIGLQGLDTYDVPKSIISAHNQTLSIVHFNFASGSAKIEVMKQLGFWVQ